MNKWNWASLSKGFTYTMQIAGEFMEAKSAESDGGKNITAGEMVGISAKVSGVWAQDDGLDKTIRADELIQHFKDNGWQIVGKASKTKGAE
jgi:hypothetical protein